MTGPDAAAGRPVTLGLARLAYWGRLPAARSRFEELDSRATAAAKVAWLRRNGRFTAADANHRGLADVQPLSKDERLEHLATGALLAEYYANEDYLHDAVESGATWDELAAACGRNTTAIQGVYRRWIEGQHKIHEISDGYVGFDDDTYAVASAQIPDGRGPRELCVHADTGDAHWLQADEDCLPAGPARDDSRLGQQDREAG